MSFFFRFAPFGGIDLTVDRSLPATRRSCPYRFKKRFFLLLPCERRYPSRMTELEVERRSQPGTFGYVWCAECLARFVIAGRRGTAGDSVAAVVACPECLSARRLELPRAMTAPFRVVTPRDPMRRDD